MGPQMIESREKERRFWAKGQTESGNELRIRWEKRLQIYFPVLPLTSVWSLFLSDGEVVPNIILNVQPGTNHLGPEDFELMLEEVTEMCHNVSRSCNFSFWIVFQIHLQSKVTLLFSFSLLQQLLLSNQVEMHIYAEYFKVLFWKFSSIPSSHWEH